MINVSMTDKNGVTLATAGKYCDQNVNVTPSADILRKDEQEKSATPSTSSQDITPDAGMALSKVTVNPITPAIVGGLDAKTFAAAAAAAIEGKGVTVPDGTLLDGMAALIGSIEAGGSGSGGIQSASGEFSIAADVASLNIDISDIGFVPDLVVVYLVETGMEDISTPTKIWYLSYVPDIIDMIPVAGSVSYSRTNVGVIYMGGVDKYIQKLAANTINYVGTAKAETGIHIHLSRSSSNNPIIAGTYKWFAYKIWSDG